MRRLIIAISLLMCICIVCVLYTMKLYDYTSHMIAIIEETDEYAEKRECEKWGETANSAKEYWKKISVFVGAVTRHDEMDEITLILERYIYYAQAEDYERYMEQSEVLKAYLIHLVEAELPLVKNIL